MACDLLPPVPEHAFTPLASTLLCRELSEWAVFRAFHSGHCMEYIMLNNTTILLNSGVQEKERSINMVQSGDRLFCLSAH